MQLLLVGAGKNTEVLLLLAVILLAGFCVTRLTNSLKLPKVSGYIIAGVLIGPGGLGLIPKSFVSQLGFISDLALAFISFGVGKFLKKEVLQKTGKQVILITLCESLTAGIFVTIFVMAVFRFSLSFSLILGAIATATAPASTMMTINQYKARGRFVNTLLQVMALDNIICLLTFSVVSAIAAGIEAGSLSPKDVILPITFNIVGIGLGALCAYLLSRLITPARSKDNRLILVIVILLGISGLCAAINISPLLACMMFGAVYINVTKDKKIYRQVSNFTPPVMSLFFIVSGMNLDVRSLKTVGAIGLGYFFVRIVGKFLGAFVSCHFLKTSPEIRNYLGMALIPQAGVAIGLAFLGQQLLPESSSQLLLAIILSSSVLYELVGPASAKAALVKSGCIKANVEESKKDTGKPEDKAEKKKHVS